MKKVSEELRYDGATTRAGARDAGRPRRSASRSATPRECCATRSQIDADDEGMTVEIDQVQAAKGIPGVRQEVRRRRDQHRAERGLDDHRRRATSSVVIPGKPGEITGTALLTEDPDGTTETVNLTVQGEHPAGRREDRGPRRRPAQQGAPRRARGRPSTGWPAAASSADRSVPARRCWSRPPGRRRTPGSGRRGRCAGRTPRSGGRGSSAG